MRKQPRIAAAFAACLISGGMLAADAALAAEEAGAITTTAATARKANYRRYRARPRRPQAPPTAENFARLRQCESGGNYAINTGNGYYGAYQFSSGTWRSLGYSGLPSQASAATQDEAAAKLQAQQGWRPWPGCSRKLRLR